MWFRWRAHDGPRIGYLDPFFSSNKKTKTVSKLDPSDRTLWIRACFGTNSTPGRRQSKILLAIDERGSKISRNSVFDCQMAIENYVSIDFLSTFVDRIDVFDCHLPGVNS